MTMANPLEMCAQHVLLTDPESVRQSLFMVRPLASAVRCTSLILRTYVYTVGDLQHAHPPVFPRPGLFQRVRGALSASFLPPLLLPLLPLICLLVAVQRERAG
jgi:hypothetical protein